MCVAPRDGLSPLSQISSEEWQRDTPEGSQGWTVLLCPKFPVRNARGTPVCSALLGAQSWSAGLGFGNLILGFGLHELIIPSRMRA